MKCVGAVRFEMLFLFLLNRYFNVIIGFIMKILKMKTGLIFLSGESDHMHLLKIFLQHCSLIEAQHWVSRGTVPTLKFTHTELVTLGH
jgi:hypothetical protein